MGGWIQNISEVKSRVLQCMNLRSEEGKDDYQRLSLGIYWRHKEKQRHTLKKNKTGGKMTCLGKKIALVLDLLSFGCL